ncbi:mesenchyme-specific cell surface glycoprotein-like [Branchiostoma floridae]|uniref:Mesenchyme-specific cell surface glycoprotein-like n=1 Tax=Branchiostoma floridae TaxID=7739 RepID=A0A9J7LPA4_BRAFL|nr:mesenchyme-specific cell surface glycoprotein-like [Branchiostoma floridae]
MAFAVLMMMAAAVLPNSARSAITLSPMGSTYLPYGFDPAGAPLYGMGDRGAVEQLTYDADNYHIYTVGEARILNVIDISDPKNAALVYQLQLPGGATDVDSCGRFVAVSIHDDFKVLPGTVLIYSMYDTTRKNMTLLHQIQVGALPDMVKFTKDCMTLVTCNEGEPGLDESGNFVDPEGSASVIAFQSANLGQESAPTVRTAMFRKFDSLAEEYNSRGVRWTLPMIQVGSEVMEFNLSQTLEPEYVAYNSDGSKAYIALQENNAIAVLDMATATFDDIYPLGSKYWGTASIDTSHEDGGILMRDWPIYSLYQPDSMRTFSHRGRNYILTANEGDGVERVPPNATVSTDELKGTELIERSLVSRNLKSQRVQKALNLTSQLGCAVFSSIDGLDPENPDKYSSLHLFGGRGFSVWDADDLSLVWDSGDGVERMVAKHYPSIFNSDYYEEFFNSTPAARFDHRSCKKGPETESLAIGEVDGKTAFFVGNERSSTILVYSLADEDIITPVFQSIHFSGRTDLTWRQAYQDRVVGDIDPEDMRFVSTRDSPTNTPLLLVAGTASGTVSVYEVVEPDDGGVSASPSIVVSWFVMTVSVATCLTIIH